MATVVLIIHLLVCVCLIGLVLLQRSEGGALGMGGGGGGSLMSGRGAADALAKMTQVAGAFFLATSLGLTVLSGAAANNDSSVFDLIPRQERTATPPPAAPAATPETTRPDPTESSAPEAADTQLASTSAVQPEPTRSAPRAAPLGPSSAAAATPPPRQATTTPTSAPARAPATTPPPAANRSGATTTPTSTPPAETAPPRQLVLPSTSGSGVNGISLTDDPATQPESIEIGNGVEAVRREQRAGPDQ
jgi:preprotein translocase subunit SecG